MPEQQRDMYTAANIAARLGISRSKAYELMNRGEFGPVTRLDGMRFIPRPAYEAWLEKVSAPSLAVVAPEKAPLRMNPRWGAQQKRGTAGR